MTASCIRHHPRQHRDGKPPWCPTCGLTAQYEVPVSVLDKIREFPVVMYDVETTERRTIGTVAVSTETGDLRFTVQFEGKMADFELYNDTIGSFVISNVEVHPERKK